MAEKVWLLALPSYDQALCDAAVERLFAALPAAGRIGPESKVLLKPNLLAKHAPEAAVTTHPAILRAVIRACKARGAVYITVADSSGGIYNPAAMKSIYKVSGLWQVCEEEQVECYTGCESDAVAVKDGRVVQQFEIIRPVLAADFIIDLPKFKTHVMTGMTAAVKNLFGVIPGLKKAEWHMRYPDKERFGQMLIDLLQTVKPDMVILDGVLALEGDGPAGGEPRQLGLVMGSEDLVNLDLAVCGMMGLDPMRVPYLRAAKERGLCAAAFDPTGLVGDTHLYAPIPGWQLPGSYRKGGSGNTDFADSGRVPAFLAPLARQVEKYIAPHPVVDKARCIGCGKCAEICLQDTIVVKNQKARILTQNCIRCFCCHEMCPVKAIQVKQLSLFKL